MENIPLPLILIILSILSKTAATSLRVLCGSARIKHLKIFAAFASPHLASFALKQTSQCLCVKRRGGMWYNTPESKEREHVQNAIPQTTRQKPPIGSVRRSARRAEMPRSTSPQSPHERGKSSAGLRAIHAITQGIAAQDKGSDKAGPRESIMLVCTNYHDAFTKSSCCFSETIMMVSLSGTRLRPHSCRVPTVVVRRISPDPAETLSESRRGLRQVMPRNAANRAEKTPSSIR